MGDRWEDWFEPGETLLWEGAPAKGLHHPVRNSLLTLLGFPFAVGGIMAADSGLALVFGAGNVFAALMGLVVMAFSVPFLLLGAGLGLASWIHDLFKHDRVRFALSDRAGYIATRWWNRDMTTIPIHPGTRIEYDEKRNGIGAVWFHFEQVTDSDGDTSTKRQGFEGLANPQEVFALVRQVAGETGGRPE